MRKHPLPRQDIIIPRRSTCVEKRIFINELRPLRSTGVVGAGGTLIPSAPQNFTVEKILPSTDGTFLALAGPKGVSIIELPRRWGPNGQYQNGKECIICRGLPASVARAFAERQARIGEFGGTFDGFSCKAFCAGRTKMFI
uniref:Uncharacterized protein n=1 Tax=Anopheles stephensi TaxID=30069 RepID=A0A182YHS6_ANOST